MAQALTLDARRTSADDVFDYLLAEINSLKLLPGTRISEVEIARQFDLSRQPVREAFIRLANVGLLLVRPQKATLVRGFSTDAIHRARFVRLSVEVEVMRRACSRPLGKHKARLERIIAAQEKASRGPDIDRLHALDFDFHRGLCAAAGTEFIFETIRENKSKVDRLCILSLSVPTAVEDLIDDHRQILSAVARQDEAAAVAAVRHHLSRLDDVIDHIRRSHANYFED